MRNVLVARLWTVPSTLLQVRQLGDRRILEAFTLTGRPADDALVGRHRFTGPSAPRLRFGDGDSRRCLLITGREVLIVSAPADSGAGVSPRLLPLRAPGALPQATIDDAYPRDSAPHDSAHVQQPFVVAASVVDGGFVVLLGVVSDRQGRLLDYYDERGQYIQSAMLPFTASAMTGAGPRFLVLHHDEKFRWWLSSWITPMAAHGASPPPEPRRVDQAPNKRLFEPPTVPTSRPRP